MLSIQIDTKSLQPSLQQHQIVLLLQVIWNILTKICQYIWLATEGQFEIVKSLMSFDKNFIGIIHDFRFVYTSCALRWSYLFRREMPLVFLMASCAAHLFSFQKLLGLTLKCGIFTAFTCCLGQWTETIVLLALLPYAYSILSRLLRLLEFQ